MNISNTECYKLMIKLDTVVLLMTPWLLIKYAAHLLGVLFVVGLVLFERTIDTLRGSR